MIHIAKPNEDIQSEMPTDALMIFGSAMMPQGYYIKEYISPSQNTYFSERSIRVFNNFKNIVVYVQMHTIRVTGVLLECLN